MIGLLGIFGAIRGFLSAIPAKAWLVIGCVVLVLIAGWRVQAWAAGKDRQIEAARAETAVARGQRLAAVLYGTQRQTQVFADAASLAALQAGLERQNASLAAAEVVGRRMTAAQAQAARQTATALQARDRTIAGLRARQVAPDDCGQARELLRGN